MKDSILTLVVMLMFLAMITLVMFSTPQVDVHRIVVDHDGDFGDGEDGEDIQYPRAVEVMYKNTDEIDGPQEILAAVDLHDIMFGPEGFGHRCLAWAFGEKGRWVGSVSHTWNRRHGDIFTLTGSEPALKAITMIFEECVKCEGGDFCENYRDH